MPINYKIERKYFEQVGDLVGAIIALEFENQVLQYYNTDCEGFEIFRERITPVGNTERVINVSYAETDTDNKHQASVDGDNTYFIDVIIGNVRTASSRGDKLANLRLQRIMGIIWEVLEHPIYKNLLQDPGFVLHSQVTNLDIIVPKEGEDAQKHVFGRVTFRCKVNEVTGLQETADLLSSVTQVRIGLTENGYRYEYGDDTTGNPAHDTNFVKIVNLQGETLALLTPPAIYTVDDLQEIIDTITDNESQIIDPID